MQSKSGFSQHFVCPLTGQIMNDPVFTSDGETYDRHAIQDWFSKENRTNPITHQQLASCELVPNKVLKQLIEEFKKAKKEHPAESQIRPGPSSQIKKEPPNNQKMDTIIDEFEVKWKEFKEETIDWLTQFRKNDHKLPEHKRMYNNGYYRGEVQNNMHHGLGIMYFKSGSKELGEWKSDKLSGRSEKYIKNQSKSFAGIFRQGELNGLGQLSHIDKKNTVILYRGQWRNGKRNGFGVEIDPETKKTYLGEWVDDIKNGRGREIKFNGDYFDGKWKNGLKHGKGIKTKTNGKKEDQFWENGRQWGNENEDEPATVKMKRDDCDCKLF